jgi:drug/metabolite transporter (DMT)-like permease
MGQITEGNIEAVAAPAAGPATSVPAKIGTRQAAPQGLTVYDALLFSMICVWAANPAALKWVLQYMDPLVLNSLRFALATSVPVALLALSKEGFRWQKGDGWKVFALGIVGHGLYQLCFIVAVSNTLAGNVALIISTSPAFIAIFGALLGYERVRAYTWIGVALSLSGVGLVILGSGETVEFGPRLIGDLLAVATTMMWGMYSVLSQPLLTRYSSVKLNALTMPWGAGFLLLAGAPAIASTAPGWGSVPAVAWAIVALSGLLAVSFSYIVWYKGIQKLGATRASAYANLVPVMAAFIAYFALGEPLTGQFWVGMVLVLSGVSLARFGGRFLRRRG